MSKSKDESVARLKESQTDRAFFWIEGETTKKLVDEIEEHGGPEVAKVKFWPGLREDGRQEFWFQVENSETKDCGECFNVVHTCPPEC